MKKGKMITAMFVSAMVLAGYAEAGTVENLSMANGKIASMNIKTDFGEAGSVLDNYYTGSEGKGRSSASSAGYVEIGNSGRTLAQAENELCNAQPGRSGVRAAQVPPLEAGSGADPEKSGLPLAAGGLAAGALILGLAGGKKSYWDSVATVANAIAHPVDTYNDYQAANQYDQAHPQQGGATTTAYTQQDSSGAHSVGFSTGTQQDCPESSTDCFGGAYVGDQAPHYSHH